MITITLKEAAEDYVNSSEFDKYVQDSFWNRDFDSSTALYRLITWAKENEIEIVEDGFDVEGYLWDAYNNTEKGLS